MKAPRRAPLRAQPEPWDMPEVPRTVVYAFKALSAGKASEGQQRLCLSWITFDLCGATRTPFTARNAGIDGRRVSDFMAGMHHVAQVIARIVQTPVVDKETPESTTIKHVED